MSDDEPLVGVVVSHPIPPSPRFGFDAAAPEIIVTNGFYIGPVETILGDEGWTHIGYTTPEGIKFSNDG